METLKQLFEAKNLQQDSNGNDVALQTPMKVVYPASCSQDSMYIYLTQQRNKPLPAIPDFLHNSNPVLELLIVQGMYKHLDFSSLFRLALVSKAIWNLVTPKLKRPNWMPAFPVTEDLPRENGLSFCVFYFPGKKNVIHRITLTRTRANTDDVHACFADGNLLYLSKDVSTSLFHNNRQYVTYNSEKWKYQSDGTISIGDTKLSIIPNHRKHLKLGWDTFIPRKFDLVLNGEVIGEGKPSAKEKMKNSSVNVLQWGLCFPVSVCVNPVALPIIKKAREKKERKRKCDVEKRFLPPDEQTLRDVGDLDKLVGQFYETTPSSPKRMVQSG